MIGVWLRYRHDWKGTRRVGNIGVAGTTGISDNVTGTTICPIGIVDVKVTIASIVGVENKAE